MLKLIANINRVILITILVITYGIGSSSLFASQDNSSSFEEKQQEYYAQVRDALSEISFVKEGDTLAEANKSIQSLSRFIEGRSGIKIEEETKLKLAQLELEALSKKKGITIEAFQKLLITIGFNRLSAMSDADIANSVDILRGLKSPDLPTSMKSRKYIHPRASIVWGYSPQYVENQLKFLRDPAVQPLFESFLANSITTQLNERLTTLSLVLPEEFGFNKLLSPEKAFFLSYSLVCDDPLKYSLSNLKQNMELSQKKLIALTGQYPSPKGHTAYGSDGYFYSFPVNYFFDSDVQISLLNSFEKNLQ